MPTRVAQIGTGNVGTHALRSLITNPDFELTGVWVSSEAKAGKDAAELVGLDSRDGCDRHQRPRRSAGPKPDCAVYTAMADNRLMEALEDYRRILAAGVNVVGSGPVFLQWPWQVIPDEMVKPIEEAAREGNSSVYVNRIDPGFANDLLPLALTGTCQSIEQVRCMEIVNYATYDSATVMFDVMGFGKPMDEIPMLLQPGVLSIGWGSVVRQLAAGLGLELDGLEEMYVREPAPESFDISSGHIAEGTARAAVRGHRTGERGAGRGPRAHHPAARRPVPEWPQPAQPGGNYRIEVTGEPLLRAGPVPEQPERRPQPRRRAGHRDAHRQRDPRGGGGKARHLHHPGPATGDRQGLVRCDIRISPGP